MTSGFALCIAILFVIARVLGALWQWLAASAPFIALLALALANGLRQLLRVLLKLLRQLADGESLQRFEVARFVGVEHLSQKRFIAFIARNNDARRCGQVQQTSCASTWPT